MGATRLNENDDIVRKKSKTRRSPSAHCHARATHSCQFVDPMTSHGLRRHLNSFTLSAQPSALQCTSRSFSIRHAPYSIAFSLLRSSLFDLSGNVPTSPSVTGVINPTPSCMPHCDSGSEIQSHLSPNGYLFFLLGWQSPRFF